MCLSHVLILANQGEVGVSFYVQHSADHYMLFCHMPYHTLPLAVNHCSKHSKPPGTPTKLIQILGNGNCLFWALSYAVTGRQIYARVSANNKLYE